MSEMTVERAFSSALSALVARHDVTDVLAQLLEDCALVYPAAAVALLVSDGGSGLELLSATSHRVEELELLQIQRDQGPCIDAMTTDTAVLAAGSELVGRWGDVGSSIADAGFGAVHAYPLHWRGRAIGGLNIFLAGEQTTGEAVGQAFADIATLVVVQSSEVPADQVSARVHEAVAARSVVEQAKGVLAYQLGLDMAAAYDELRRRTALDGQALTESAAAIVGQAHRRPRPPTDP